MALQGPFVVVADNPVPDVVQALQVAGAFPIVETTWADAAAAMASVEPEAIVLAETCGDREHADEFARALERRIDAGSGAFTPVIARLRDDNPAPIEVNVSSAERNCSLAATRRRVRRRCSPYSSAVRAVSSGRSVAACQRSARVGHLLESGKRLRTLKLFRQASKYALTDTAYFNIY